MAAQFREEDVMATYRLVWRNAKGIAFGSTNIECGTDAEALGIAERQIGEDKMTIDVWEGFRPVGRVGSPDQHDNG
jgi:hypothetical protein